MPIEYSKKGPRPSEFMVTRHERAFDGFMRVDRVWASQSAFRQPGDSERFIEVGHATEVMIRGDSVAALLYDPGKRSVILVEQFRLPSAPMYRRRWVKGEEHAPVTKGEPITLTGGWIVETVAGSLRNREEPPETCMRREIEEEAGYRVTDLKPVAEFFSSPGGTSEMVYLYYAEVSETSLLPEPIVEGATPDALPKAPGLSGEDINVLHVPVEEFFDALERSEYKDPKIIISGYWLRDHLARTTQVPEKAMRTTRYRLGSNGPVIGIKTGNIKDVIGVDAWINPENTNMQMDRFFGRSVSAAIRWQGAEKVPGDDTKVKHDGIAEDLRRKLGDRYHVGLGDIVETSSGALLAKNGVKTIYHVAIAEGFVEQGLRTTSLPTLRKALTEVLRKVAYRNSKVIGRSVRSLLVPMMGTGTSGVPVRFVAPALVATAIEHLKKHPEAGLRELYFNAFSIDDRSHLKAAFQEFVKRGELIELSDTD